jgi:Lrp/AsnC family transcriptional regulator, leucine-responsive regulatory protein
MPKIKKDIVILDKIDKKILSELDLNSRQPISIIAKRLKLSRTIVEYRMQQLEKLGVIRGYVAFLDPYKFGFASWKVYFKFQNMNKEIEKEIHDYLGKQKNIWWVISTMGSYDLMFCVLAKNAYDFYESLMNFQQKFNKIVLEIAITNHINSHFFNRGYLKKIKGGKVIGDTFTKKPSIEKLDQIDYKILKVVSEKARMPSTEIAKKLKTTPAVIIHRLKNLEKKALFVHYILNLDVKRFGYEFYKVMITLKDFTKQDLNSLKEFFKNHPNIENNSQSYGPWNMEFEMEVENYQMFNQVLDELRGNFSNIITKINYVLIKKEEHFRNDFLDYVSKN